MRAPSGFLAEMALFSRSRSRGAAGWSPDEAIAARLLAGQSAGPDARPSQQALAEIFRAAARPGTRAELSGQAAAVNAFVLTVTAPGAQLGRRTGKRPLARKTPVLATAIMTALVAGVCGTAAANVLPTPLQQFAHVTFGAPAPERPASVPTVPTAPPFGSGGIPTLSVLPSPSAPSPVSSGQPTGRATSPAAAATTPTSTASSNGNGKAKKAKKAKKPKKVKGNGNGDAASLAWGRVTPRSSGCPSTRSS
jgi:hypothetical protein